MLNSKTADKDLPRVQALIQKAAASIGGQNELARRIGYSNGQVSNWAAGREPCPPKAQAVLADLAGFDAIETVAYALVAQEGNPRRKEALLRALGKRFAHLGAAAFFGISAVFELAQMTGLVDTMRRKVKPA